MSQDININIGANAQGAVEGFDATAKAADGAAKSTQDLGNSLELQEARIKTLDGAINLLGGSVELLAGGLALTGAVTKEQAEEFQTAAIGAIAFADGAKRVLDGYKSLTEGLAAYGGVAKAARAAQAALNTTILANPYVAAAVAIAAVTAAVYALVKSQDDEEEQLKRLEIARERYNKQLSIEETNRLALLKAQGLSGVELAKEELKAAEDLLEAARDRYVQEQINNRFSDETAEARLEVIDLEGKLEVAKQNVTNAIEKEAEANKAAAEAQAKANEQLRNARLEAEGLKQTIQNLQDETIEWLGLFKFDQGGPVEVIEEIDDAFADLADTVFFTKEQLDAFNRAEEVLIDQSFEARRDRLAAYYDDLIKQAASNASEVEQLERAKNKALGDLDKERANEQKKNIEDAAKSTLATTIGLLATIRETTDDGSKEGFEKSKKFRIAETRLSSIQAAFDAYKSLVGVPYVGPILAVAAAAAALAAGQKAIQDIKSSTFEGGGAPSNPASGAGSGAPAPGISQSFNQGGFLAAPNTSSIGPAPVRAYVVSGDVEDGLEADQQLQRRRRLGPG